MPNAPWNHSALLRLMGQPSQYKSMFAVQPTFGPVRHRRPCTIPAHPRPASYRPGDPVISLAVLGQARGYQLLGDTAKARTAYQDFFALWKDADPDIPILKEAKAEYAKLQ